MLICENCGKEHDGSYGSGRFCCGSCRASFTNKKRGKRSEETKQKISEGVKKKILSGDYTPCNQYTYKNSNYREDNFINIESLVNDGIIDNPHNYKTNNNSINKYKLIKRICPVCGKEYIGYINKNGNISFTYCSEECKLKSIKNNRKHKPKQQKIVFVKVRKCCVCGKLFEVPYCKKGLSKAKTCSKECHLELQRKIGKQTYTRNVENGTFQGWQSRNIISYPEKFWITVLNNNNIDFIKEYFIDKKYFLDFYIVKNGKEIDLEIDGKQHKYEDRVIHDQIRDEYITSKNILVYRIDWNEINTDKGKDLMKEKIDNFLNWYNNL